MESTFLLVFDEKSCFPMGFRVIARDFTEILWLVVSKRKFEFHFDAQQARGE